MRRLIIGPILLLLIATVSLWTLTRGPDADQVGEEPPATPQVTLAPLNPADPPADPTAAGPSGDAVTTTAPAAPTPTWADDDELVLAGDPAPIDMSTPPEAAGTTVSPRDEEHARELEHYEDAAVAFMSAFARPDPGTDPADWWAEVEPLMADRAAGEYALTDPQQVPFTKVTGPARSVPTPAPTHLLRQVRVPTDAGSYLVGMETDERGIHVVDLVAEGPRG